MGVRQVIAVPPQLFALLFSDHFGEATNKDILGEDCRLGLEGIVSKRTDLPYVSGRGDHWQKSKCSLRQEFIVVGFVRSAAQPRAVGSLVLAYHEGDALVQAGRAGTGLDAKEAAALAERLEPLKTTMPHFASDPPPLARRGVIWVKPQLAAEIEYRGWSSQGLLRQAAIKGLRDDKPEAEIVLEHAEAPHDDPAGAKPKRTSKAKVAVKPGKAAVSSHASGVPTLTHPDKLLWADVKVSKRMLADYYTLVAERCLPHVAGRVLALLRCPEGTSGQCFFAKHA